MLDYWITKPNKKTVTSSEVKIYGARPMASFLLGFRRFPKILSGLRLKRRSLASGRSDDSDEDDTECRTPSENSDSRRFCRDVGAITLIEVMVTLVVLSFGLTLIIRSFMMSLRASHLAKDYTVAVLLAEEFMWDYENAAAIDADLDEEGEFPEPYAKFKYRLETEKKVGAPEESDLNQVKLTISWEAARKSNSISVDTLLPNTQE